MDSPVTRTLMLVCCFTCGCDTKPASTSSKQKPAQVNAYPDESDIYRIVLTKKAQERLRITTIPAAIEAVSRTRLLGGEMVIPDGNRIPITAPLTGTLLAASGEGGPLHAGQQVSANQTLMRLMPMLPPQQEVPNAAERVQMANARATLVSAQIQADGDVKQATARVTAAEIALARARKLLSDKAGSQRDVDDAEATLNIASKGLEAAQERKDLLEELNLEAEAGQTTHVPIRSPRDGMIRTVLSRHGQVVPAGAPLFEIVDLKKLWIKVAVYAGLVDEIDGQREARIGRLNESIFNLVARPIEPPPTADPLAAAVDLYYELQNTEGRFRPGERVAVQVPLKGETESLVVPRAAVLRDIHGTEWVYVNSADSEFRRKRVAILFTTDELAVLSRGPAIGERVVVDGAAELFGTEFGAGK